MNESMHKTLKKAIAKLNEASADKPVFNMQKRSNIGYFVESSTASSFVRINGMILYGTLGMYNEDFHWIEVALCQAYVLLGNSVKQHTAVSWKGSGLFLADSKGFITDYDVSNRRVGDAVEQILFPILKGNGIKTIEDDPKKVVDLVLKECAQVDKEGWMSGADFVPSLNSMFDKLATLLTKNADNEPRLLAVMPKPSK